MIPNVEFIYSGTYDHFIFRNKKYKRSDYKIDFHKKIKEIEKEWRKYEKKILSEISKLTNLKWQEPNIKCYVVTSAVPFSEPLTIPAYNKIEKFIDVLIHELIHHIFHRRNYRFLKKAWGYVFKKYKDESLGTKLHIPLHAIHTHLFLKFFGEERMRKDIESIENFAFDKESYFRSWEITLEEGYGSIIDEFRKRVKA